MFHGSLSVCYNMDRDIIDERMRDQTWRLKPFFRVSIIRFMEAQPYLYRLSHQALPPSMVALATGYAFRALFEDTAWPKHNKQTQLWWLTQTGLFFPPPAWKKMFETKSTRSENSGPSSTTHLPCLITMNHGLHHPSQTQFWKNDKFSKNAVCALNINAEISIDCPSLFYLSIGSHEGDKRSLGTPYLTVAARKPVVQVRKKQTAISSGHISLQVVKTFRLPRECLPSVPPALALAPKPQTLMLDCFPYRHLPAVSFPCPK